MINLSLCLICHYTMKTYVDVEILLHRLVASLAGKKPLVAVRHETE